jgi:hypothetical protein
MVDLLDCPMPAPEPPIAPPAADLEDIPLVTLEARAVNGPVTMASDSPVEPLALVRSLRDPAFRARLRELRRSREAPHDWHVKVCLRRTGIAAHRKVVNPRG